MLRWHCACNEYLRLTTNNGRAQMRSAAKVKMMIEDAYETHVAAEILSDAELIYSVMLGSGRPVPYAIAEAVARLAVKEKEAGVK